MNILLDNPLANMDGILFLALYGFVILFTLIGLAIAKSNADNTDKLPLPPIPAQIEPYKIAYLRSGINEVARSIIFSLTQKGFIEIKTQDKNSELIRVNAQTNVSGLPEIEQTALNWLGTRRETKEVFDLYYGLVPRIENYGVTYRQQLENEQMLTNDEIEKHLSKWKWIAVFVILGLGGYKFLAAILNGYFNFFFLLIFGFVGSMIAVIIGSKMPRITKHGKAYLERLQMAFENLKYQSQAPYIPNGTLRSVPQTTFGGIDPLLLSVGVFGPAILAGTVFADYNLAFQRAQNQTVASGSSCGSACGTSCSSASSCSSGSDGGGSSCGGGCGGGCGGS